MKSLARIILASFIGFFSVLAFWLGSGILGFLLLLAGFAIWYELGLHE